jgi:uncharacterized protein YdbL (DUF1318 family)
MHQFTNRSVRRPTLLRLALAAVALGPTACTFNFELTSQRTALENQVMGAYKELDDDLVLVSSMRGPDDPAPVVAPEEKKALDARQNQEFNRDDVDELKDKGVLGETAAGTVTVLPRGIGAADKVDAQLLKLAQALVTEENRDRDEIWKRIIASNANLGDKDMPAVRKTYAKMQRDTAAAGHWLQDDDGRWRRKDGDAPASLAPAQDKAPGTP